jgi:heme/copper-type cytochrome/quinol oxidase subunit 1
VFEYARNLQTLNDWVSISSFLLGVSILIFVFNFVYSTVIARVQRGGAIPGTRAAWSGRSPRRRRPATSPRVPVVLSGPYEYGVKDAPPVADLDPPLGVISNAYAAAAAEGAEV